MKYLRGFLPPGVIMPFAGATAPDGWLMCEGAAISRTTYSALYAAISVAWGYGDNSTTFKKLLFFLSLFLIFGAEFAFGQSQNFLINGGFDLWQRGTTNAAVDANGYLADRWFATDGTYDRISANLPTGQKYGASHAVSATTHWFCQRIEADNIRFLSGQKMTISGYERSSTGTNALKIKIDRPNTIDDYTGKGKLGTTFTNEIAATTLLSATSTTLTPWRYTFTVSSNMATYGFQVCLGNGTSTGTTYEYSAIMLNEGFKKQAFRRAGSLISDELGKAQRYYENGHQIGLAGDSIGAGRPPYAFYKTSKRIAAHDTSCTGNWFRTDGGNATGCAMTERHADGIGFSGPNNNLWTFASIYWIADAEL
jgi:hypothetical protein